MKFLKYLFFLIVGLVLAFIAIGFIYPTIKYGHEITVTKSVKEAWAIQQDEAKFGQWLEGFKSIDLISGEAGTVGSKYKVIVNPEGRGDFEMTETITSVKEFDHFQINFDSDMMLFDQTTSFFVEAEGNTIIRTESIVNAKGMMMRSMFALMEIFTNSFQKQEVKNIEALKKVIEENTTDYYPAAIVPDMTPVVQ